MSDAVLDALTQASRGLQYPSETDAPFEPFVWEKGKNTAAAVRKHGGLPKGTKAQTLTLDDFFADLLDEKPFQALRAALEAQLSDVKVYQCGAVRVTYFVVGTAKDGRLAGLKTTAVET